MLGTAITSCARRGSTTIIVKDQQHAERVLDDYLAYYHGRPHRGLRMQPPTAPGTCPLPARQTEPESLEFQSSAVSTIVTASPRRREPHRRWNSVPLEPRMEFLRPTTGDPAESGTLKRRRR
jgi:hypothetical protein